jgi:hypothetical protein
MAALQCMYCHRLLRWGDPMVTHTTYRDDDEKNVSNVAVAHKRCEPPGWETWPEFHLDNWETEGGMIHPGNLKDCDVCPAPTEDLHVEPT